MATNTVHANESIQDFFENAASALHWVDVRGIILRANQYELDALGYERDEYVGHHISEFHADPAVIADILDRLGRNETLRDYEAPLLAKDGSIRHVLINSNVRWGPGGEFIHTRCFTRDITDRKLAELALAELTSTLDATVAAELERMSAELERTNVELERANAELKNHLSYCSRRSESVRSAAGNFSPSRAKHPGRRSSTGSSASSPA